MAVIAILIVSGTVFYSQYLARKIAREEKGRVIAFGEALGGSQIFGTPTHTLTWMGAGVMPSYWDCQSPPTYFTFGSPHVGVVNFAFCDGSVRAITTIPASAGELLKSGPACTADVARGRN